MTVHTTKLLTGEEAASSAKLVSLGYVAMSENRPRVTGDGLMRITEIE
jgi:hypothetical protein